MTNHSITLSEVVADSQTTRLNHFAGRYLSEHEFDLMQEYVAERCEDLLRASLPGIVHGLDVRVNQNADVVDLSVMSGLAVSGAGTAIAVAAPIHLDWDTLIAEYQRRITPAEQTPQPVTGYYFLTVKRQIAIVDESDTAKPCERFEPNPLRDSRLETWATLDLQFISRNPSWLSASQTQVTSRVFNRFIQESPFDDTTKAVPLALLKIEANALSWADTRVGRFHSEPNPVQSNFLDWWEGIARRIQRAEDHDASQSLAAITGCDFLPAAGPFPDALLSEIAGHVSALDEARWTRPVRHFTPYDLQIEMVPVPDNSVTGTLATEISRGVVDLAHNQQDRIRIMVAVNADDYRPDLLNLPEVDHALLAEAQTRYEAATADYNRWAIQYFSIYGQIGYATDANSDSNLSTDELAALDELLKTLYLPEMPIQAFAHLTRAQRTDLGIPANQPAPQTIAAYLAQLADAQGQPVSRPYSQHEVLAPDSNGTIDPPFPSDIEQGLYYQREKLRERIEAMETLIDKSTDLINESKDFIHLQRQQLDSITVSYSTLAGGVVGDGSGLSIMRRADSLNFRQVDTTDDTTGN